MTTETDLLPLPEPGMLHVGEPREWFTADQMHAYARDNVARATALLRAEIETLRAEVEMLRDAFSDDDMTAGAHWFGRYVEQKRHAERLAEALRRYGVHDQECVEENIPICTCGLDAALEQEKGRG